MYSNTAFKTGSALLAVASATALLVGPTHANSLDLQQTSVETHPSSGEVRDVAGSEAKLVRSADGVFLSMATSNLTPGNAYTLWIVAINAPEKCENSPCTSSEVMGLTDDVKSDLGFGDGLIAGPDGKADFVVYQPVGAMDRAWFGHGLQDAAAEIHAVLRDHGPLQDGAEASMLSTFRGGCSDTSVPDSLPASVRADGMSGSYTCSNVQMAIFTP